MIKVKIDPTCRVLYASFYIQGLYDVFGKKNVCFSSKHFKNLVRHKDANVYGQYMAFVVIENSKRRNIIIDFQDKSDINENAYNWCDFYAKVNFNPNLTKGELLPKIISIPPGFGIRIWNYSQTLFYALMNYFKSDCSTLVKTKTFFGGYLRQYKRPKLNDYVNLEKTEGNYIFMIGTAWYADDCIKNTNILRKSFVDTCKELNCDFEGGFICDTGHPQYEFFKEYLLNERYSGLEYVKRTQRSVVAFNTPAVWNCHGWKLAEYLAMGKAIISTSFVNKLPVDLKHGEEIHFISEEIDMKSSLEYLLNNEIYRKKLEKGSSTYWEKYVSPKAVISNLLNK